MELTYTTEYAPSSYQKEQTIIRVIQVRDAIIAKFKSINRITAITGPLIEYAVFMFMKQLYKEKFHKYERFESLTVQPSRGFGYKAARATSAAAVTYNTPSESILKRGEDLYMNPKYDQLRTIIDSTIFYTARENSVSSIGLYNFIDIVAPYENDVSELIILARSTQRLMGNVSFGLPNTLAGINEFINSTITEMGALTVTRESKPKLVVVLDHCRIVRPRITELGTYSCDSPIVLHPYDMFCKYVPAADYGISDLGSSISQVQDSLNTSDKYRWQHHRWRYIYKMFYHVIRTLFTQTNRDIVLCIADDFISRTSAVMSYLSEQIAQRDVSYVIGDYPFARGEHNHVHTVSEYAAAVMEGRVINIPKIDYDDILLGWNIYLEHGHLLPNCHWVNPGENLQVLCRIPGREVIDVMNKYNTQKFPRTDPELDRMISSDQTSISECVREHLDKHYPVSERPIVKIVLAPPGTGKTSYLKTIDTSGFAAPMLDDITDQYKNGEPTRVYLEKLKQQIHDELKGVKNDHLRELIFNDLVLKSNRLYNFSFRKYYGMPAYLQVVDGLCARGVNLLLDVPDYDRLVEVMNIIKRYPRYVNYTIDALWVPPNIHYFQILRRIATEHRAFQYAKMKEKNYYTWSRLLVSEYVKFTRLHDLKSQRQIPPHPQLLNELMGTLVRGGDDTAPVIIVMFTCKHMRGWIIALVILVLCCIILIYATYQSASYQYQPPGIHQSEFLRS